VTKDSPGEIQIKKIFEAMARHREQAPDTPDPFSKKEEDEFEKVEKRFKLDKLSLQNQGLEQLIQLRTEYSKKIFGFLIFWSIGVGLVLIFQAFNIWGFSLPESVLDVLVGSTTVNVIALVGLVVKGLFPGKVSE